MARLHSLLALAAFAAAALPAHAMYKVVGPDGKVTYTDRPPPVVQGRVTPLASSATGVQEAPLPIELRQATQRYPVTLFTTTDCAPCDDARRLLRQRGIPHTERLASTDEDREAWARVTGGSEAPAALIGTQPVRGFAPDRWNQYLDAAGYPRESKLPPTWQFAAPAPLVPPRQAQARVAPPAAQPEAQAPRDDAAPPATPGFRF